MRKVIGVALVWAGAMLLLAALAQAHGFEGDRFFPPTITTDDPFAVDELNLPTVSFFKDPGDPITEEIDASFELDKEILPKFALGITDTYIHLKPYGQSVTQGWDDLTLSAKYQLWESPAHEAIISIGAEADIGGTGTKSVSESFSTFTPIIYGGKGFGDLTDFWSAIRPFAITGTFGVSFPTETVDPNALRIGLAVEYNLPYLEQSVRDIGLPHPFRDIIPVVEFSYSDPINRGQGGQITGTINPGFMWETPDFQFGAEAVIPTNSRSGNSVGAVVSVQIFIDDLFPRIFGHPLFGGQ